MPPCSRRKRLLAGVLFFACLTGAGVTTHAQTAPAPSNSQPAANEQLARALISAASADERRALLAASGAGAVNDALRQSLMTRGKGERDARRYSQALACYQSAREVAAFLGDRKGMAAALYETGATYHLQTEFERAVECYDESRRYDAGVGDTGRIADALFRAGAVYFERGDYGRAMEFYRRSLAAHEQNGSGKADISGVLYGIGAIHYLKGEYAEALELHKRSLKLAEESGELHALALSLFGVAHDYLKQGDYGAALKFYERSLKAYEGFGEKEKRRTGGDLFYARDVSTILRHTGTAYYMQGNYPLALSYYERCLRSDEAGQDTQGIAHSLGSIGGVYRALGDYPRALDYLQRSLSIFEKLDLRDGTANILATLGGVYHAQGDHRRALEYFRRAIQLREKMDAKEGLAAALAGIAFVHLSQGDATDALAAAERAADISRRIGSPHVLWGALLAAGRARRSLKQYPEARLAFDESIRTVESLRVNVAGDEQGQELFFSDKLAPYYEVLEMLVSDGKPEEALAYAEAGKARALLDVLRAGRASARGGLTAEESARERVLKNEITNLGVELRREQSSPQPRPAQVDSLRARLEQARLAYAAFRTNLYARRPELRLTRGEARPVTKAEIGSLLPDDGTAIIEYAVTDERTYLFVTTKAAGSARARGELSLKVYSIDIARRELARQVGDFRQQLARRDLLFAGVARSLHDLLLGPASDELRGLRHLIIVPDDGLWELPFQALQQAGGSYLIEQCAVSYAPSLTALREMTRKRRALSRRPREEVSLLAVGNPRSGPLEIARAGSAPASGSVNSPAALPEAERQVKALAQLYGARQSRVYTGAAASEERVKREAGDFRVLHLATHGTLNDASPMYSFVLLTPSGETSVKSDEDAAAVEDGLLEAWELMEMSLRADLVVLSACETARGRFTPGEGVIGLTWALLVAGSPSTVVSQWKVESTSTTELMVAFHRNLLGRAPAGRSPLTKAEALRRASLRLLQSERYAHPFYWAGFVLVGDGE